MITKELNDLLVSNGIAISGMLMSCTMRNAMGDSLGVKYSIELIVNAKRLGNINETLVLFSDRLVKLNDMTADEDRFKFVSKESANAALLPALKKYIEEVPVLRNISLVDLFYFGHDHE